VEYQRCILEGGDGVEYQRCILKGGDVGGVPEMHIGGWRFRWNTRDTSLRVEV